MFARCLIYYAFIIWIKSFVFGKDNITNFYDLLNKPDFVDKTHIIDRFFKPLVAQVDAPLQVPSNQNYFFITYPPGFGKTTSLQLIRNFAEFETKNDNMTKPYNETKAYQVFKKLAISTYGTWIQDHLAQYAVIYLDLTFYEEELVDEITAAKAFRSKLARSLRKYDGYFRSNSPSRAEGYVRHLLMSDINCKELHRSIYSMARALDKFHGKGTVLLIDNFDSAARISVDRAGLAVKSLYRLIHKTLNTFLEICEPFNELYRKCYCMITAVTSLYFKSMEFKSTQNFIYHPFLQRHRFTPDIGFRRGEANSLMFRHNCFAAEIEGVQKYYIGYTTDKNHVNLYNPVAIIGYLDNKRATGVAKLEPYWARNQSIEFIATFARAPLFREKMKALCEQGVIKMKMPVKQHDPILFCGFLESSGRNYEEMLEEDVPELIYYVVEHGFLKHTNKFDWFSFTFGNEEVKQELKKKLEERGIC